MSSEYPTALGIRAGVPLRVLVVEDSEDDALLVLRELRRGGYEPYHERVETPEAMRTALAEGGPWDIVVCDYRMPRFRTSEALAILKESGLGAPFVVVSGMVGEEAAVEAMRAGAHDFVTKDNLARLAPAVARELREAEVRRERRRAERELREKEAQYRGVFEATSDGLVIRDPGGRIVDANPAMCEMHGYSYEELLSLEPAALVHPSDRDRFLEGLRAAAEGGTSRYRRSGVRKDGSVLHLEVHASPLSYGGKPHVLNVVRDVTERVEAYRLLEERVEERTRELSALLKVSSNVASTLELESLLGLVLDQMRTVVEYVDCSILTIEGEELVTLGYRGPVPSERVLGARFSMELGEAVWAGLNFSEPLTIDDVLGDTPSARAYREVIGEERLRRRFPHIRSWIGVPLILKGRPIGLMVMTHDEPGHYAKKHAELARTIANQAAIAIENARLYERAQSAAVLEERQRLARELHDSVSQALYGIALGAKTARTLLDRDPPRSVEPLDYVLSLADAGLAEMRALIFELRPESLESEGLVVALEKQAASLRARHGIEVHTAMCEELDAPLAIEEALYRVAQEALHNTVKHARAAQIELSLMREAGGLKLEVRDNGVGFDPAEEFPGHLGLRSMRERAARFGGTLEVESAPGRGTRLCVWIPITP